MLGNNNKTIIKWAGTALAAIIGLAIVIWIISAVFGGDDPLSTDNSDSQNMTLSQNDSGDDDVPDQSNSNEDDSDSEDSEEAREKGIYSYLPDRKPVAVDRQPVDIKQFNFSRNDNNALTVNYDSNYWTVREQSVSNSIESGLVLFVNESERATVLIGFDNGGTDWSLWCESDWDGRINRASEAGKVDERKVNTTLLFEETTDNNGQIRVYEADRHSIFNPDRYDPAVNKVVLQFEMDYDQEVGETNCIPPQDISNSYLVRPDAMGLNSDIVKYTIEGYQGTDVANLPDAFGTLENFRNTKIGYDKIIELLEGIELSPGFTPADPSEY